MLPENTQIQKYLPAMFFVGGFAFDLLTTDRIDQTFSLVQQFIYLMLIMLLLFWEVRPPKIFLREGSFGAKVGSYRVEVLHFLFGSLLSLYTIFYFKSASLVSSFAFMALLTALLFLNELSSVKKQGLMVQSALFALCLSSYFIYLVPVVSGALGWVSFTLSMIISMGIFLLLCQWVRPFRPEPNWLLKNLLGPGLAVQVVILGLYIFKILPPVPVSLKHIGIYHQVSKTDGVYQLAYERPRWRFWESGAQSFVARPGDKVHCFASVFSPTQFREKVSMQWWLYSDRQGQWLLQDTIPFEIRGGRDQGFRGYAVKSNYEQGDWQVRVVTSDLREIGRIGFRVLPKEEIFNRTFQKDQY